MRDNKNRSQPNLPARIALPAILSFFLFVVAIFFIILPALEDNYLSRKREMIRELTESAWSVLSMFHGRERSGLLTREEAQAQAITQIQNLRYGPDRKDYFWINDMHPRMVMHPYRPDLEGKDISNFTDINGKRLFVAFVDAVRKDGEAYVDYMWQWKDEPGKIVPKLSYVKGFEPWGWIIGTGVYTNDIHIEMAEAEKKVSIIATGILIIVSLLLFHIIRQAMLTDGHRRQAEEELKASETHLRTLIQTIPDLVWLKDRQGVYLFCNTRFECFFGAKEKDIIGKTDYDFVDKELADFFRKHDKVAMAKGKPSRNEEEVTFADDGHREILETIKTPMYTSDGKLAGVLGIGHDITERKRAEEALLESEKKYRNLFENAQIGLFRTRLTDGLFLEANQRLVEMFGYDSRDELIKQLFIADYFAEPETRSNMISELKGKGEVRNFETQFRRKDGSIWWARFSNKLDEEEGYIEGVMADITETKQAEAEKAHFEEQYRQAQKVEAIGRLAGGVAHDMNNLLTPILGYGEMLMTDFSPDDRRLKSLEQIVRAGYGCRDLVRQLLAFGRKQTLEPKPLDINKTIEGFEKLLRRTIREDIAIEIIPSPEIRTVKADIGQIEQVIMNLSVNAQDAMPDGGRLTLETAMVAIDEDYTRPGTQAGHYVMLAVSDTGCGMDAETRGRIFEPFFSTKGEQGTGLGLATVHGIVKQHGGNIWVYSEPGKGTIFKIYLPISEEAHVRKKVQERSIGDLLGSETILLVEDNEQVRDLGLAILAKQGYTVLGVGNGAEALAILTSHDAPVHLLLTDVVMPRMNGRELFTRATDKQPGMKVLYMSGYTDSVIAHHGILDEGVQFIQKPFTPHGLATKVREVLDKD